MSAPTTDGGVIQATTRQSTRPARACWMPPVAAEAALMAMFVPAAVDASPETRSTSGKPQRAEDEPEHRPEVAGHERAGTDNGYFPGFQSVSGLPAAAFAARARMKSRSESRFR